MAVIFALMHHLRRIQQKTENGKVNIKIQFMFYMLLMHLHLHHNIIM